MIGFLLCNLPEHSLFHQHRAERDAVKTTWLTQPTRLGLGIPISLTPPPLPPLLDNLPRSTCPVPLSSCCLSFAFIPHFILTHRPPSLVQQFLIAPGLCLRTVCVFVWLCIVVCVCDLNCARPREMKARQMHIPDVSTDCSPRARWQLSLSVTCWFILLSPLQTHIFILLPLLFFALLTLCHAHTAL